MQYHPGQDRPGMVFYFISYIKIIIVKVIAFIFFTVYLFSCGNKSAISKKLSGSDSLVITFNVPNKDSVINMVSTTEKKAIRKLSGFLNGNETKQDSCGFDGNMIFFNKEEIVQTVVFQYSNKNCRHFLFELDNKTMSTAMSNEAAEFLKSLVGGKSWY
jgi:hypothetical protein